MTDARRKQRLPRAATYALDRARHAKADARAAAREVDEASAAARTHGASYEDIAAALGTSASQARRHATRGAEP